MKHKEKLGMQRMSSAKCFERTPEELACFPLDHDGTNLTDGTLGRFKVFTAMTILLMLFWVKAPCGLIGKSQRGHSLQP
jgi:hypothetical protein